MILRPPPLSARCVVNRKGYWLSLGILLSSLFLSVHTSITLLISLLNWFLSRSVQSHLNQHTTVLEILHFSLFDEFFFLTSKTFYIVCCSSNCWVLHIEEKESFYNGVMIHCLQKKKQKELRKQWARWSALFISQPVNDIKLVCDCLPAVNGLYYLLSVSFPFVLTSSVFISAFESYLFLILVVDNFSNYLPLVFTRKAFSTPGYG